MLDRFQSLAFAARLVIVAAIAPATSAAGMKHDVQFTVQFNHKTVQCDPKSIRAGRALMALTQGGIAQAVFCPAFALAEIAPTYDPRNGAITLTSASSTVKLAVGSRYVDHEGIRTRVDVGPTRASQAILIPLRVVMQSLGARVDWIARSRVVAVSEPTPSDARRAQDTRALFGRRPSRSLAEKNVTVLLPRVLVSSADVGPLYAVWRPTAKRSSYRVDVARDAHCVQHACEYAEVSGTVIGTDPAPEQPTIGVHVSLAHDVQGLVVRPQCGASCAPMYITWTQGATRYTVAQVAANQQDLVAAARSMQVVAASIASPTSTPQPPVTPHTRGRFPLRLVGLGAAVVIIGLLAVSVPLIRGRRGPNMTAI